jgi:hypothetical protein
VKRIVTIFGVLAGLLLAGAAPSQEPAPKKFARGAKPTPQHKFFALPLHLTAENPPPQFAVVPKKLSVWLNDRIGCCVTSEEMFSKAGWSIQCGLDELFIPDDVMGKWVYRHGYQNGATLTDVMDDMIREGITFNGTTYRDGPYNRVDYTDLKSLQSAIATGPVKIAIDANALPRGAGNGQGWHQFGGGRYPNTDHCVGLAGYGSAKFCFDSLNVPLPAGVDPNKGDCFLLFTWGTIGVVDLDWIRGTTTEAYVRIPTTPGQEPKPAPAPPPAPPVPDVVRHHPVVIGIGVLLLFGAAAVAFVIWRRKQAPKP